MRYSCNDIFMVRTPSLPASVFSDFVQFEGNDVENFLQQTPFRDFMDKSILLSSRELYNAKKRNLQSSTKKSKARNLARIKFLIRACTRPTPYGLFAGAALGEFCENPNIEPLVIDERKAILECRADYSWLSHFIYEMENNFSSLEISREDRYPESFDIKESRLFCIRSDVLPRSRSAGRQTSL